MLLIEAGLAVVALVLALTIPDLGSRWFEAVERSFGKLARRRGLSVVVVGLSALALRAALLPILPIPHPLVPDEFAQLMTADTFTHGRLTNPTPHLWTHFESLMIIMKPTYNSKYPPAQSLFLAAGQVILGHPFWGVWLSLGLMCGAICWMLQAWVGEGWALLGGFLAVVRIAAFSYWANSYWGGAVAALGGALVLGALPRLKKEHRVRNALLMGLGVATLANSRPYEGLVFSIPVAVALFAWIFGKKRPPFSVSLRQVVLPLCLLLGLMAAGMGYYNWRVTGNPLRLPYLASADEYDPTPHFLWESMGLMPKYRHVSMASWEKDIAASRFNDTRSLRGLIVNELTFGMAIWLFNLGPLFSVVILLTLVTLPYGFSRRDVSPESRFLLLAFAACLASVVPEVFFYAHYLAPMTCLFLAVVLLAMRAVISWRSRGGASGLFFVRAATASLFLLLLVRIANPFHLQTQFYCTPWFPLARITSTEGRSRVLSELNQRPGRDVVLVRYSPDLYDQYLHSTGMWPPSGLFEWVYNSSDIDNQKVIWAQDMGAAKNEELIRYYKDRHVWLLYADDQPPKLVPYAEPGEAVTEAERR